MSKVKWDEEGKRYFETGVSQVVLYPKTGASGAYAKGVAWNGVTAINESPSGGEPTPMYADNIKYLNLMSPEDFGLSLEAYTYPDEFAVCDGSVNLASGVVISQQPRKAFGLCYKTQIGNDEDGSDHAYKLHIVYGCMATPSEKSHSTINDSVEAETFSYEISTTAVAFEDEDHPYKPTAHIVIDSRKADEDKLAALEALLYGTDPTTSSGTGTDASLPDPDTVLDTLAAS